MLTPDPELDLDMTVAILNRVASLSTDQQAEAWAQCYEWEWPSALADFKPSEWDSLSRADKASSLLGTLLAHALETACPLKDRLRHWNTITLMGDRPNMTTEQFEAWWSVAFQELT